MRKQGLFILLLLMSLCSMMRAQTSFTYGGLNYTVLSEADGTAIVGKNAPSRASKRSDFLKFYAQICHVIDDFCLSWFATLR